MNMKTREILLRPAAMAAYSVLTPMDRKRVDRVVDWLKYRVSDRPFKLLVFKSRDVAGRLIVRASSQLRIVYHKSDKKTVVVDDIIYKDSFRGFGKPSGGAK